MQIPTGRLDAAFWVYQSSVLAALIMIMSIPYNATIIAHERMSAFACISVLEVLLKLGIVYLLLLLNVDKLILYAVLIVAVQFAVRICYGWYCKCHFKETRIRLTWNRCLIKEMLSFAGWSIVGNAAYVAYTQGINVLLNIFSDQPSMRLVLFLFKYNMLLICFLRIFRLLLIRRLPKLCSI